MRLGERSFANSLFGAMHETGHGLYEQNVDPAFTRTALTTDLIGLHAGGGASLGTHESQSRLQENHIGRSHDFWRAHFGRMKEVLGGLDGIEADAFHRAVNTVAPGLIRTEADELTYDFHIMLRVELEAALLKGDIKVADIPGAWREAMKRHLGVTVPNDREGCLQDVHWASGAMGSFCTYTLGNVMAAQLFETAKAKGEGVASRSRAGRHGAASPLAQGEYLAARQTLQPRRASRRARPAGRSRRDLTCAISRGNTARPGKAGEQSADDKSRTPVAGFDLQCKCIMLNLDASQTGEPAMTKTAKILEVPATITARGQTTVPAAIRKMLALGKRDEVVFRGLSDGTVVIAKKEARADDRDPVIGRFLEFLARDMAREPRRNSSDQANAGIAGRQLGERR